MKRGWFVRTKKGQRYLTVVCDHLSGKVAWAAKGRSRDTVKSFFDAVGEEWTAQLQFVTCDGAEWIRTVLAERAAGATVCLDTFHLVSWATDALDEIRREEWDHLRRTGGANAAKEFKGLRWTLLRNWENLTSRPRRGSFAISSGPTSGHSGPGGWKRSCARSMAMPLLAARRRPTTGSPVPAAHTSLRS